LQPFNYIGPPINLDMGGNTAKTSGDTGIRVTTSTTSGGINPTNAVGQRKVPKPEMSNALSAKETEQESKPIDKVCA
jgi:hypothetical protein